MSTKAPPNIDDLCLQRGFLRPSRRDRIIKSTPRVGRYYWVDYPHDAYAPEFMGPHPGVVIRAAKDYGDPCSVIPITSQEQPAASHIHKLSKNPNPLEPAKPVWAICSHIYTVSMARLRPVYVGGKPVFPKVEHEDMDAIFACIRATYPAAFRPLVHTTAISEKTSITVEGDAVVIESDTLVIEADD